MILFQGIFGMYDDCKLEVLSEVYVFMSPPQKKKQQQNCRNPSYCSSLNKHV